MIQFFAMNPARFFEPTIWNITAKAIRAIGLIWLSCVSGLALAEQSPTTQNAQTNVSTAQTNVAVIEQTFQIPQLNRPRKIRLYLPPDYANQSRRYPVLYMHDAQNLFDATTSYAGEWQVDEILNQLYDEQGLALIVVGIDNGGEHRLTELSAWDHVKYGVGEGEHYLNFIIDVVKPYMDTHYRTKAERTSTGIMGSSMGGLMSHYAIFSRPDIFSKAGIYSPSYWYSTESYESSKNLSVAQPIKLDFLVGSKEGGEMVSDMLKMVSMISKEMPADSIRVNVVEEGQHNEGFWSSQFKQSVSWLFSE